jgi:hypothetical protein
MDLKKDLWSFRDTRDTYENSMKTRLVTWRSYREDFNRDFLLNTL